MSAKLASTTSTPVLGSGTNVTVAAAKGSTSENLTPDSSAPDEDKVLAVDAHLIESEHILVDYLSLFPKEKLAATERAAHTEQSAQSRASSRVYAATANMHIRNPSASA